MEGRREGRERGREGGREKSECSRDRDGGYTSRTKIHSREMFALRYPTATNREPREREREREHSDRPEGLLHPVSGVYIVLSVVGIDLIAVLSYSTYPH